MIVPAVLIFLLGCTFNKTVKSQYYRIRNTAVGDYYMDTGKYKDGIRFFKAALKQNPDEPRSNYYLGRCYLAGSQPKAGLAHLQKAVSLAPDNADYLFWLGVAYAANKRPDMERKSYLSALSIEDDHIQALCYLGHNQLADKEYSAALESYNKVLEREPHHPQALYNRGLIMKKLGRTSEEITAWQVYLENYPTGAFARATAFNLNEKGVFDYRNYLIGRRAVTLKKIEFEPFTAILTQDSRKTLDYLGGIIRRQKTDLSCQLVYYQENNLALAEARVKSVKKYLLRRYSSLPSNKIKVAWFKTPEKIKAGKKVYYLNESLNLFTTK